MSTDRHVRLLFTFSALHLIATQDVFNSIEVVGSTALKDYEMGNHVGIGCIYTPAHRPSMCTYDIIKHKTHTGQHTLDSMAYIVDSVRFPRTIIVAV